MGLIKIDEDFLDGIKVKKTPKAKLKMLFCGLFIASGIYHTAIGVKNDFNNQLLGAEKINELKTQLSAEIPLIGGGVYKDGKIIKLL